MKKPKFYLRDFLWFVAVVAAFIAGGAGKLPLAFLPASPTTPKTFEALSAHDLEPFAGTKIAEALWTLEQEVDKNGRSFTLLKQENRRLRSYIASKHPGIDPKAEEFISVELRRATEKARAYEKEAKELGEILATKGIRGEQEMKMRQDKIDSRVREMLRERPDLTEPENLFPN